jgi:hypothetical protein
MLTASAANAGDIGFEQSVGVTASVVFTQSMVSDHKILGLDGSGVFDPTQPTRVSGDFSVISIKQTSTSATTMAATVVTSEGSSTIEHELSGSGAHELALTAEVGTLHTTVVANGTGAANISLSATAPGQTVSHNLIVSGGPVDVDVIQLTASDLNATINSTGIGALASFALSGLGSTTNVLLDLGDNATFSLNQTGVNQFYSLEASLGRDATLVVNQQASDASNSDLRLIIPDGQSVTLTR